MWVVNTWVSEYGIFLVIGAFIKISVGKFPNFGNVNIYVNVIHILTGNVNVANVLHIFLGNVEICKCKCKCILKNLKENGKKVIWGKIMPFPGLYNE